MSIDSTVNAPLKFFELYITETNIKWKFDKFIEGFMDGGYYFDQISKTHYFRYYDEETNENGVDNLNFKFREKIEPLLNVEVEKSKGHMLEFYANSLLESNESNKFHIYIENQIENVVNHTISSQIRVFIDFPYLLIPLKSITEFVNLRFDSETLKKRISINSELLEKIRQNASTSLQTRIEAIIAYKDGFDENGNEVYSEIDKKYLIEKIELFLLSSKIPTIERKLDFIPDRKLLLNFTFRVLYESFEKEYGTLKIDDWIHLLIALYNGYSENDFNSIKSNFNRPRFDFKDFMGDILELYMSRRKR